MRNIFLLLSFLAVFFFGRLTGGSSAAQDQEGADPFPGWQMSWAEKCPRVIIVDPTFENGKCTSEPKACLIGYLIGNKPNHPTWRVLNFNRYDNEKQLAQLINDPNRALRDKGPHQPFSFLNPNDFNAFMRDWNKSGKSADTLKTLKKAYRMPD